MHFRIFSLLYQKPYPHCFPYPYVLIRTPLISHLPIICRWSLNCCSEFQLIAELGLPIYSIFIKILENSYLAHLVLPFLFCFIMHLWIIQKIRFNPIDHNHCFFFSYYYYYYWPLGFLFSGSFFFSPPKIDDSNSFWNFLLQDVKLIHEISGFVGVF